LGRPFYSERTKWAFNVTFGHYHGSRFQYQNEKTISSFQSTDIDFDSRISYLLHWNHKKSTRISILYHQNNQRFSNFNFFSPDSIYPQSQQKRLPGIGIDWINLNYIKEKYIDKFGVVEDVSLGVAASFYVGKGVKSFGARENQWYIYGKLAKSAKYFKRLYLSGKYEYHSYLDQNRLSESVNRIQINSYLTLPGRNIFIFHSQMLLPTQMPPDRQLFLGENRGLRGYPNYFQTGQKRLIFNFEERFYSKYDIYTFGLGTTIFSDIGFISEGNQQFNWQNPYISFGVGLRIGSPKAKGAGVLRFDLAWRIDNGPQLILSFGNNNFFSAYQNFNYVSTFPKKFGEYR